MRELPKYVRFKCSNTVLRYRIVERDYWVNNGEWGVGYKGGASLMNPHNFVKFKTLYSVHSSSKLNNKLLIECTEEEWIKSVGRYNPYGFENVPNSDNDLDSCDDGYENTEEEFKPRKGIVERYNLNPCEEIYIPDLKEEVSPIKINKRKYLLIRR